MRKEIENWWKQALKDMETAEKLLEDKEYYACAFFCQQSVEKALKALFILKKNEASGDTHSLVFLGKEVGIPPVFFNTLRKLNPDYILTRYPDVVEGVPFELYDGQMAGEKLKMAKDVVKWAGKALRP